MVAKRARRCPEDCAMCSQSGPKGLQKRQVEATGATKTPKMDPKTCLFGDVVKSEILKDLPYEINEFGALGPQKSDPKSNWKAKTLKGAPKTCHERH